MNIRKSIVLSVIFLSVFLTSYPEIKTEIPSQVDKEKIDANRNKIVLQIKDKFFDGLLDYNFLDTEYKILAVKTGNILINQVKNFQSGYFVESNKEDFFKNLLRLWNTVEASVMIWQAAAFVSDDYEKLSYRRIQQVKLKILSNIINNNFYSKLSNIKFIHKLIKPFVPKKMYSKYKEIFEVKEMILLDEIGDYFTFIYSFLKNSDDFGFSLDEEKLDSLIKSWQEVHLSMAFAGSRSKEIKKRKITAQILNLFLDNLFKIKYYNININSDFDNAFSGNDYSKRMLVMNYHILFAKRNFKFYLKNSETSTLFNRYIDLVNFYLNNQDVLSKPLFIYTFFQFYSDLNDLKEKKKGIIPFIHFGGNGKLLNVINEIQEVLNIILKKIHEQMGTGLGWLPKLLLGKAKVPQEVVNFAMKLLEENVLRKF